MASALIQSNAQSALISTLNSASAALVNPFEYSISKRIPSHGCQWIRLQPVNSGHTKPSDTLHFDLIHMGFTRSATLKLDVSLPSTGSNVLKLMGTRLGFLQLIDRIDISSSSRRILSMTQDAIMCAISDLPYEQRMAVEKGLYMGRGANIGRLGGSEESYSTGTFEANAENPVEVYLPLLFSVFDSCNLALATGFTEPIRVSVRFADGFDFVKCVNVGVFEPVGGAADGNGREPTEAADDQSTTNSGRSLIVRENAATSSTTVNAFALNNVNAAKMLGCDLTTAAAAKVAVLKGELILEQRLLPNELEDATIAKNYGSGPLSQLVYDYEQESVTSTLIDASQRGVTLSHEIKSTSVVTDIYVFVTYPRKDFLTTSLGMDPTKLGSQSNVFDAQTYSDLDSPIEIRNITLKASGQVIYDKIPAKYLGIYGRRTLKDGFIGSSAAGTGINPAFDMDLRTQVGNESGRFNHVYRLQFGLDDVKQYDSGAISLRELNAPTIEVELYAAQGTAYASACEECIHRSPLYNAANRRVQMKVVLRKLGLQTTDSSSGRVVSTLSN